MFAHCTIELTHWCFPTAQDLTKTTRLSGKSASESGVAGRPWQTEQSNRQKLGPLGPETEGQGQKARGRRHSRRPRPVTVKAIGTSSATVTVIVTRDGVRWWAFWHADFCSSNMDLSTD